MTIDPTKVSFSVAQGYKPLPQPLKLEELDHRARVGIWNAFYVTFVDLDWVDAIDEDELAELTFNLHMEFFGGTIDEAPDEDNCGDYFDDFKGYFMKWEFNQVFDFLTFLMRHRVCPETFISELCEVFSDCQLAYVIDTGLSPTIYPSSTPEEGQAIIDALGVLKEYGLDGARQHLMQSSVFINRGQWAHSVHESISAVESVARRIAPETNTLGDALKQLKKQGLLKHPALHQGLERLYGYTSDEQGVRHSLLDQGESNVGQDEAVFMLGACASFASYLWRKGLGVG